MKNFDKLKWSYKYQDTDLSHRINNFCEELNSKNCMYNNENIGKKYFEIWNETIDIYKLFLQNNCILADKTHDVIVYLMSTGIFENNSDIYHLYRGMGNLKNNHYKLPKKYYNLKYINILKNMNNFLQNRIEKEKKYGLAR